MERCQESPNPTDVSDEAWSFAAPYLVFMTQDAPQREHSLREVVDALRWIVRAGWPWRLLIVLFGGGTKRGQQRDIDRAKELHAEYKTRKKAAAKTFGKHKR